MRWRLMGAFVLAAVLPMAVVGLWARGVLVDLARAEHQRRVASTVVAARDRIEQQLASDRRAMGQLCARDVDLRSLGAPRPDGQPPPPLDAGAWRARAADMRRVLGMDVVEVRVVRAPGRRPGTLVAASPAPLRDGGPDPKLLAEAREAGGPFVTRAVMPDAGRTEALVVGCEAKREGGTFAVLGARVLDASYVRALLGDVMPIALRPAAHGPPTADHARVVHTFRDARGEPVVLAVADMGSDPLSAHIARLDRGFLITAVVAVLVALFIGAVLALAMTRPLRELELAARRVGAGDLESTIGGTAPGEVGDALEAFNRMTRELKRTRAKLLRAERIAAWKDIARRIAHEIKNPLSPIQVSIETMRKTYASEHPDFDEIFEESTLAILEEVDRLKRIVTEFSQFARMPRPTAQPLDVAEVAEHVVALHQDDAVAVRLHTDPATPTVRADREQITQVLSNLVLNAVEATRLHHPSGGGEVRVTVGPAAGVPGATVTVDDQGAGIAEADRDRVFEPYFTTKEGGTGLGLAIVHRIVLDHGGELDVQDAPGGGARMRVHLRPEGPPLEAEASLPETALPLTTRK